MSEMTPNEEKRSRLRLRLSLYMQEQILSVGLSDPPYPSFGLSNVPSLTFNSTSQQSNKSQIGYKVCALIIFSFISIRTKPSK